MSSVAAQHPPVGAAPILCLARLLAAVDIGQRMDCSFLPSLARSRLRSRFPFFPLAFAVGGVA